MKPNQFDELAKAMALSVTRRAAVKKFGYGLTTLALAALGLSTKAQAARPFPAGSRCKTSKQCKPGTACIQGVCVSSSGGDGSRCGTTTDCQPGLFCYFYGPYPSFGTCRPYPSGPGGPCNIDADCASGLVCNRYGGISGGYCTSP
jgi:hypothetical protein